MGDGFGLVRRRVVVCGLAPVGGVGAVVGRVGALVARFGKGVFRHGAVVDVLAAHLHDELAEGVLLADPRESHLAHLQEREEGHHQLALRRRGVVVRLLVEEQVDEADLAALVQELGELHDALGDGDALEEDLVIGLLVRPLEDFVEGVEEPEDAEIGERRGAFGHRLIHAPLEHLLAHRGARAQLGGDVFVLLVLEQPADELRSRILFLLLVAVVARLRRKQRARLDVGEGGRHHEVFARHVDGEPLHEVEVLEVLLGDEADRDVEDVELVLPDQMEQQVERALEDVELHLVGVRVVLFLLLWGGRRPPRLALRGGVHRGQRALRIGRGGRLVRLVGARIVWLLASHGKRLLPLRRPRVHAESPRSLAPCACP